MHQDFARALDACLDEIHEIKRRARAGDTGRPRWPMIVLRSPKGWTGPKEVDGKQVEGTWRAHPVPLAQARENEGHGPSPQTWLRRYWHEGTFAEGPIGTAWSRESGGQVGEYSDGT